MRKLLCILLFAFLATPTLFAATNRYVDTTLGGNCAGNYNPVTQLCSGGAASDLAYTTFSGAEAALVAGDSLILRQDIDLNNGANIRFQVTHSGTAPSPITITSYSTRRRLRATACGASCNTLFKVTNASNVIVNNIEMDANSIFNTAFRVDGTTNVLIKNCKIHHSTQEAFGANLSGGNTNVMFGDAVNKVGNEVYSSGVGGGNGECVYFGSTSAGISTGYVGWNDIHGCAYEGIEFKLYAKDIIVEHNLVHDIVLSRTSPGPNAQSALTLNPIVAGQTGYMIARYNKIYNITRTGGGVDSPTGMMVNRRADVYGNIIYNVGQHGFDVRDDGGNIDSTHKVSLIHNTVDNVNTQSLSGVAFRYATSAVGTGDKVSRDNIGDSYTSGYNEASDFNSTSSNPLWVSTTLGSEDYHLQSGSPCIAAGVAITPGTDFQYSANGSAYSFDYDNVADDHSQGAFSNSLLSPATITLVAPNGGGSYKTGDALVIKWKLTLWGSNNVKISLSPNGGASYSTIVASATYNADPGVDYDGSYSYTLLAPSSTDTLIKVEDASNAAIFDVSDGEFRVRGRYLR
jgi:hypothetical protein